MITASFKAKLVRAAAATAVAATAAATLVVVGPQAGADPQQYNALNGMGSDTTQDVMNAMAGFSNGLNYTPAQSSEGSFRQLNSWNATRLAGQTDSCIAPKVGFPVQYRPNGSSEGRRALSRAFDGLATGYGPANQCGGTKDIGGMIDFARSSSGPSSGDLGTDLVYVPFARDALSFSYFRASGGPAVTSLTRADLTNIFTNGPQTIGGVLIIPCGIQTGSGTYQSWNGTVAATTTQENSSVATCKAIVTTSDISSTDPIQDGRIQEHAGDQLQDKGLAAPAGSQVIVGFSASNFVAQCNGTGIFRLGTNPATTTGVQMGAISNDGNGNNLGIPVTGTNCPGSSAGNFAAASGFYSNATFGRNVFNVLPNSIVAGFGNNDIKTIFIDRTGTGGPPAQLCTNSTLVTGITNHGFLTPAGCGSTTLRGSFLAGIQ